jgi:hypothetical protein
MTAIERYNVAEAKVKEAFNLSEIGESIFQAPKRSRSNSKVFNQSIKEDSANVM